MKPIKHKENVQHEFDSFSKSVLSRTARDCHKSIKRRNEREIAFSAMSARELNKLAVEDKYFTAGHVFNVLGENISLSDYELGRALSALQADKREIVLMKYFFDMSDKEIAEHLNMARRTVTHQRSKSLQELKKLMESEE